MKNGKYLVTKVKDKAFIGKDIIHAAVFNRRDERTVYNVVYRDGKPAHRAHRSSRNNEQPAGADGPLPGSQNSAPVQSVRYQSHGDSPHYIPVHDIAGSDRLLL